MKSLRRTLVNTGLIISAEQAQNTAYCCLQTAPRLVLLTARDGQFISACGDSLRRIDLVNLGSLIAGDLAASHQIAQLAGVYEDYQAVLREGRNSHILVADAGPQMVLFMLVSSTVPVGWARLIGREAARALAEVVSNLPKGVDAPHRPSAGVDFPAELDKALGDLWRD
jgi:predicted regulator of Ras-like GTPase activity (Roadblock/LC7/MglB family)